MGEVKLGITSPSMLQETLSFPHPQDKTIITALANAKLKEMKEKQLESIKISRHTIVNLNNSYTLLNDGTILRHFHAKDKDGTIRRSKEQGLLIPIEEHHIKIPKKMFDFQGNFSHVLSIFNLGELNEGVIQVKNMINTVKEMSRLFIDCPFILRSHCLDWKTKEGLEKQALITRYVGMDLFMFIKNPPPHFSYSNLIEIMLKMSNLVKEMHDKNWAHFDLKPENFLIDEEMNGTYNIYLIDFDFSLELKNNGRYSLRGTPEFLAPELLNGTCYGIPRGKKADIYSLGKTFEDLIKCVNDQETQDKLLELCKRMCMQTALWRPSIDEVCEELSAQR